MGAAAEGEAWLRGDGSWDTMFDRRLRMRIAVAQHLCGKAGFTCTHSTGMMLAIDDCCSSLDWSLAFNEMI